MVDASFLGCGGACKFINERVSLSSMSSASFAATFATAKVTKNYNRVCALNSAKQLKDGPTLVTAGLYILK